MKWFIKPSARQLCCFVLVALSYVILGKLGLLFARVNPSISAIWPPTGLAIASLLIFGIRLWPAIFLGACIVNVTTVPSILPTLGIATGNTLEALVATIVVRRFANGLQAFALPRTIVSYVFWAGIVSTMVSAIVGVATLAIFHQLSPSLYITAFITWWLGDMGGAIIVAPLILLWTFDPMIRLNKTKTPEFILLFLF